MEDFYRFLSFSAWVLFLILILYLIYYLINSLLKERKEEKEKEKNATPYTIFNDRALQFWLDSVSVASLLLTLKYSSQTNWWLETDWVLLDSYLNYFNSLIKNDLEYWLEQFKLATEIINDNEIVNIDYIKEKIEERKKTREEKDWKIALIAVPILIIIALYYRAVDTDNTETFYTVLVVWLLIIFAILWLWFTFVDSYDEDLSWWQKTIKYLFIVTIMASLFSWVVSMIWLPFAVIAVILLGIFWQLYKMNNKQ